MSLETWYHPLLGSSWEFVRQTWQTPHSGTRKTREQGAKEKCAQRGSTEYFCTPGHQTTLRLQPLSCVLFCVFPPWNSSLRPFGGPMKKSMTFRSERNTRLFSDRYVFRSFRSSARFLLKAKSIASPSSGSNDGEDETGRTPPKPNVSLNYCWWKKSCITWDV